tara:strand:+ start:3597 stop:3836 length:240 start_codon:yes stop_codon:yes gene_type:complete
MSLENEKLKIQQVIAFLGENEQYGDDWQEHIDILQKVCDEIEDEEPEMPEGGWECSECGAPVNNMNDVCSQSCFNAMMR